MAYLAKDNYFDLVIRHAVSTYGKEEQTQMLFEEMSELQDALCKFRRGRDTADHVCEEIADVMIMCFQMAYIYGSENVERWAENKIARLSERLRDKILLSTAESAASQFNSQR